MLTRRAALKSAAAAGAFAAIGPVSIGLATVPTDRRLVVMILRGGADGLALVPAPGDPAHAARRGQLAEQEAIDLDGHFALHPKFVGLGAIWRAGQLAVVHAAQTGYRNRSHFDAQDMLENGLNTLSGVADGWLNRALGYFDDGAPRRGLAAGYGTPLILRGKTPIATWAPRRLPRPDPGFLAKLQAISGPDRQIGKALDAGIKMAETNRALLGRLEAGRPGSATSRAAIADLARATGRLLSAPAGARVAALEIGGWDTHGYQNIALSYRVPYLDDALVALKDGLGTAWAKTAIIVVTEPHWRNLLAAMDRLDLADDARFASNEARADHMDEVDAIVEAWTRELSRDAVFAAARRHGVPAAPVRDLGEVIEDAHMHERGMLTWIDHPELGRIVVPGSPLRFHGAPPPPYEPSPAQGEHNHAVYVDWLGLDEEEFARLRSEHVI